MTAVLVDRAADQRSTRRKRASESGRSQSAIKWEEAALDLHAAPSHQRLLYNRNRTERSVPDSVPAAVAGNCSSRGTLLQMGRNRSRGGASSRAQPRLFPTLCRPRLSHAHGHLEMGQRAHPWDQETSAARNHEGGASVARREARQARCRTPVLEPETGLYGTVHGEPGIIGRGTFFVRSIGRTYECLIMACEP